MEDLLKGGHHAGCNPGQAEQRDELRNAEPPQYGLVKWPRRYIAGRLVDLQKHLLLLAQLLESIGGPGARLGQQAPGQRVDPRARLPELRAAKQAAWADRSGTGSEIELDLYASSSEEGFAPRLHPASPATCSYRCVVSGIRGGLRWLPVGLLLGTLTALVESALFAVGYYLPLSCTGSPLTSAYDSLIVATVAAGGAGAGWWAARGVTARYGCLAGLVAGLCVAALLMTVLLAAPVPPESCGRQPARRIDMQSAVSSAVELILLAGLAGLVAARFRLGRERRQ